MKLPKHPLWPMLRYAKFEGDGDGDGGGGEDHWAGDLSKDTAYDSITKNYKTQEEQFKGHMEAVKKMGTMSGVPDDKSSDEDWDNFTAKTRPRNVGEYKDVAPEGLPEDVYDEDMAGVMKQAAHDAGIPTRLFSKLWGTYWDSVGEQVKGLDEKATEIRTADEKTVRASWGVDYDKNTKMAQSAFEKTGLAELLIGNGMNTHPGMLVLGHHAAIQLEEMAPSGGGDKGGEAKDVPWHGGYQEVKDK